MSASAVLLIRHATPEPPVVGGSQTMDNERPLTTEGRATAERLAERIRADPIMAVFSSPYRRAAETVRPIALTRRLPVVTNEDLRERRLSSAPLEQPRFLEVLQRCQEDPTFALAGGESTDQVRNRALRALENIRRATPSGVAVAGTHGGLISILRWHLGEEFTIEEALAEPMPAIYTLRWKGDSWELDPQSRGEIP
jgi:2,3-bisphosphoglycerate-dependent phosphoglycerate mutase